MPVLIGCGERGAVPPPEAIGFKAHNLARMARLGMPVPPAFVIGAAWCAHADEVTPALWHDALRALERATGLRFGDPRRPLLLSVRSGAMVSMPGMMDTLLNVGLGDATVAGLIRLTGNPRLAWDGYRRLVAGYGEIVLGLDAAAFESDVAEVAGDRSERELDFMQLRALTRRHLDTVQRLAARPFPQDPAAQLEAAVRAVFASWHGDKAVEWRRMKGLDDAMGTAVTVQRMVFGNAGGASGAGVGFTRHPSTGEAVPWVDFLFNAQGEDVVSGRRSAAGHDELEQVAPSVWQALLEATGQLEREFGDMQDFEFTVEEAQLFLLQTRTGRRTPLAAARIALDLWHEGLIGRSEARRRVEGLDETRLMQTRIVGTGGAPPTPLASARSACSGVATGEIALDEARARARHDAGVPVLLVRTDAETRDVGAVALAEGLLTARGARTAHAAVVARQLDKVCLVGCDALRIDLAKRLVTIGDRSFMEGEILTLDGHAGVVYEGELRTVREPPAGLLAELAELRSGPGEP